MWVGMFGTIMEWGRVISSGIWRRVASRGKCGRVEETIMVKCPNRMCPRTSHVVPRRRRRWMSNQPMSAEQTARPPKFMPRHTRRSPPRRPAALLFCRPNRTACRSTPQYQHTPRQSVTQPPHTHTPLVNVHEGSRRQRQ